MNNSPKPGICRLCGKPIVMHGEVVPVWWHAACGYEVSLVPKDERDAYVAARVEARERQARAEKKTASEKKKKAASGVLALPFG